MEFSSRAHRHSPAADHGHVEALPEASSARPTLRRQSLRSLPDATPLENVLGLDLNASPTQSPRSHLPPLPCGGLGLYSPSPSSGRPRRVNGLLCSPLQIFIPPPLAPNDPDTPPRPVTALYYPPANTGDLCPSPEEQSSSFLGSQFPPDRAAAHPASYHNSVGEPAFVQLAAGGEPAFHGRLSPHSPPPLARPKYIPLPQEGPALQASRRSSPIEASFRMLQLHDGSGTGLHVVRGRAEHLQNGDMRLVASLPQEVGAALLSPLQLSPAPSFRLEDLEERISHCLDALDWIHLVCARIRTSVLFRRVNSFTDTCFMCYGSTPRGCFTVYHLGLVALRDSGYISSAATRPRAVGGCSWIGVEAQVRGGGRVSGTVSAYSSLAVHNLMLQNITETLVSSWWSLIRLASVHLGLIGL